MSDIEKRRHKRYEVQNVTGNITFSLDVTVINMSVDGMAIESNRMLNVGKKYTFKIDHLGGAMNIQGTVVWCVLSKTEKTERNETVPVYKAGVVFDGILSDKASELINFLEENVIINLERRIFGRFRVQAEKPINIDYTYDFIVKTLSFSGMLIETQLLPEENSLFDMEIKLGDDVIHMKGRIAYVKQIGDDPPNRVSHLGVEFMDMTDKSRQALEKFIKSQLK